MVQLAPAARLVPQLFANTNEEAFVPVTAMLVMVSVAVPVLVMVTDWDALDVPTVVAGNVRLVTDRVAEAADRPVPFRVIICGEVIALSMMVTAAVSAPVVVGAKCPWMVQFAPGARLVPQLFANTNEEAFVPVTAMLVMVSVAAPVLVMVTDWDALDVPTVVAGNVRLVTDRVAEAAARPVPLRVIICGEVIALSMMVTAAVSAPVVVGAKCPWIVQLAPTARLVPQLLAKTNEEAFAPVTAMLVIASVAVPVLVMVTDCDALDEPT